MYRKRLAEEAAERAVEEREAEERKAMVEAVRDLPAWPAYVFGGFFVVLVAILLHLAALKLGLVALRAMGWE